MIRRAALAAIQGLYQVVQEKDARIAALEACWQNLEQNTQPTALNLFNVLCGVGLIACWSCCCDNVKVTTGKLDWRQDML